MKYCVFGLLFWWFISTFTGSYRVPLRAGPFADKEQCEWASKGRDIIVPCWDDRRSRK